MRIITSTAALLILAGCAGCESNAPPSAAAQSAEAAPPPPPQPAAPPENAAPAQPAAPAAQQNVAVQPTTDPVAADSADPADREKAQVGVGKRGRDYEPGFITTPIAAYFRTGDRIAFEVQIPSAMKLYKAAHENKGPKTHEEYWNVIIKENAVELPDLPAGDSYIYDPKTEELLVQHPKEQ